MGPVTITAITNKVSSTTVQDCLAQPLTFRIAREAEDALMTVPPRNFVVLAAGEDQASEKSKKGEESGEETEEETLVLNKNLPMKKKLAVQKTAGAVQTNGDAHANGTTTPTAKRPHDDDEDTDSGESFTEPEEQLFPRHKLPVTWTQRYASTPGFINNGVTCYMNSTLQVLLHIPALVEYLLNVHKKEHPVENEGCMMCTFRKLAEECYSGSKKRKPIYPRFILKKLRATGAKFSDHRQEDAHEFLRCFIDALQLSVAPKTLKESVKETSVVHRIFGGRFRQQIRCKKCNHPSNTYQPTLDMQLDIKRGSGSSIEDAIRRFFAGEQLSRAKGNAYKCDRCKTLADASKRTLIYDAPEYFTLHLKRFDFTMRGTSKITDFIKYPRELDMSAYSTRRESLVYELMSVIVHQGRRTSSGHYYSFCKLSDGSWASFNDEIVDKVSEKTALRQEAYILIYARSPNKLPKPSPASPSVSAAATPKKKAKKQEDSSPIAQTRIMPDNSVRSSRTPITRPFEDDFIGEVISRDAYERGDVPAKTTGDDENGVDDEDDDEDDSDFHTPSGDEAEEEEEDAGESSDESDSQAKHRARQPHRALPPSSPAKKLQKQRAAIQQLEAKRLFEAKIAAAGNRSKNKKKKKRRQGLSSPFQPKTFEDAGGKSNGGGGSPTVAKLKMHTKMNGRKL
ncbi:hypothetical protein BZA70DRAFT_282900 [Myxozyma melibiosi]|uniref:ubiquitinyl hydrolase 1 n=1 Tax=Myxozyma melibiosi TaxID=54550 RepID=A0ABR1F181_9ASCO